MARRAWLWIGGGVFCIALASCAWWYLFVLGRSEPRGGGPLVTSGPYQLVRHPLYLGWALAVFGTPHMTGDRLAFAVLSTAYLALAVPFEERSLARDFPAEYERYRRAVRWRIVPFIY